MLKSGTKLEHHVGPERLAQFAHARVIALGGERIAIEPGGMVPRGPEWTMWLTSQIQHNVPAAAGTALRRTG